MIKTFLTAIILVLGFSDFSSANIRAPYMNEYIGATELHTSISGLKVMKEELLFECDVPYRGSLDEVESQTKEVRTSATYTISSENETNAVFDFILTVNQPVKATVNGFASEVAEPETLHEQEEKRHFGVNLDEGRYKVSFHGRLKPGLNTINVRYSQPMGVRENMGGVYPIFISSDFVSTFSYDLSPLREWDLDDSFTVNIKIIFKDDSGWLKHLFGSDYETHIYSVSRREYESTDYQGETVKKVSNVRTEIPCRPNKKAPNDVNEINISFKKDFPELLEVRCDY